MIDPSGLYPKGLSADGEKDDTRCIQETLDEAGEHGGLVQLPPAKILIRGSLRIPPGVTLTGTARAPVYIEPLVGTVILSTGGRDDENSAPLFQMGNSCAVTGLTVFYPEQETREIRPYPWTFHLKGGDNTVENVTLINSYNGIRVGPEPNVRHRLRSISGCVLRRGIVVDGTTDIGRIDNVHWHSHWWSSPATGGNWERVKAFMIDNLEAFVFGRTDWEYVTNTFVYPCKIGYRFIRTDMGAMNGQLCGIGADEANRCLQVDELQPMGILVTNGQFVAFKGDYPVGVLVGPECRGSVRLVNCAFWGPSVQNIVSHGNSYVSVDSCYLSSGMQNHPGRPLIEADSGRIQIRGCSFATPEPSIALKGQLSHAIVAENNGVHGVTIDNEIGSRATIVNNEMPSSAPDRAR